jgi:methylmalonyl-CoA carboxyltransferase large subunit
MPNDTVTDLAALLAQAQAQLAELTRRIRAMEAPVVEPGITEEEVLAISAALGAYLGVRPHIKQIRLVRSAAWAQEGRVSIQASHRLHA